MGLWITANHHTSQWWDPLPIKHLPPQFHNSSTESPNSEVTEDCIMSVSCSSRPFDTMFGALSVITGRFGVSLHHSSLCLATGCLSRIEPPRWLVGQVRGPAYWEYVKLSCQSIFSSLFLSSWSRIVMAKWVAVFWGLHAEWSLSCVCWSLQPMMTHTRIPTRIPTRMLPPVTSPITFLLWIFQWIWPC